LIPVGVNNVVYESFRLIRRPNLLTKRVNEVLPRGIKQS